ncbi:hypothetical protein EB796_017960 [Bugula neritina]|uniref:Uncharacterized protein n=1 Tax=Bugula neritina TaxID=10212 RepID=A0A7J7JCS2_BUGNE|nr:hypothetical protein EB796_017960 [Bugula neritina]
MISEVFTRYLPHFIVVVYPFHGCLYFVVVVSLFSCLYFIAVFKECFKLNNVSHYIVNEKSLRFPMRSLGFSPTIEESVNY